jgi:hypothetical protein
MLEYARIFAYQTDKSLIGRDGWTDGRVGPSVAVTTLSRVSARWGFGRGLGVQALLLGVLRRGIAEGSHGGGLVEGVLRRGVS